MNNMAFYLNANTIREFILNLSQLSNHIFEISLNSSLVTDELSSQGNDFKSYAVYSEKMNHISNLLGVAARNMLKCSTGIMELSLEKTKYLESMNKLTEALHLIEDESNLSLVKAARDDLFGKTGPIEDEARRILGILKGDLKIFNQEIQKLWLLSTYLKSQVAFDEITYLTNITVKVESVLQRVDELSNSLDGQLLQLERTI